MVRNGEPSRKPEQPNFLVLLVDEERYPPVYENAEIREWRRQNLTTQERLRANSLEFHRHYIGSTACCPSRATLFTGQYPSLHGVSQTNGLAKRSFDSDMFWLGRNTVPTMGNYFREAGYRTYYKGKWHISFEDIGIPGTHRSVPSYHPLTGVPDRAEEDLYLQADPLESFGFSSWIGPEPHGADPRNSASSAAFGVSGRDVVYAAEAAQLIEALGREQSAGSSAEPWLLVASFVNPHDITLYGSVTERLPFFRFAVDPMPSVDPPPTLDEPLDTKPRCQASYRDLYPLALQPIIDEPFYRKLYYQLQKNADEQMGKIFDALVNSPFYENTIVIFTSDHGDLLGAHNHLHQKMYCAYEEMLHVPCLIHHQKLFPQRRAFRSLTSHLDLLPTMLGLAGADIAAIESRLQSKFSQVHPLAGRDLSRLLLEQDETDPLDDPIYFMTEDDLLRGQHQVSLLGVPYPAVVQPNHIETVIATVRRNNVKELWKYSRYFDNEQFWSEPGVRDVTVSVPPPGGYAGGPPQWSACASCAVTVKTEPVPEEYELYNLTEDPLEVRNLAHPSLATPQSRNMQLRMARLLEEQRSRKRLKPYQPGVPGPSPIP